jgi:minor extracellular serine protease Vpr
MQRTVSALFLLVFAAFAQTRGPVADYALLLADAPVARTSQSRLALQSAEAQARVQSLRDAQSGVLAELTRRKVAVRGTSQILLNAIFISATRDTAEQLLNIPGVVHVVHVPRVKRDLDQALNLENVTAAWNAVGGPTNAGAGIKIGIIDTGIDQNHPSFIDPTLTAPPGFPQGDSNYTNSKVIVARSYVAIDSNLNYPGAPDPTSSTPDDYSPADHVGHGTAIAMIAAGVQNTGPQATIQGVAPKAYLGNYKVFGSPGVNDYALFTAINAAMQDALADGMDVVTLSLGEGNMPDWGPLDVDPNCGNGTTPVACDVYAQMVTNAVAGGLVVVTSAGNDGNLGTLPHTLSTIHTPGTVPAAITVGASYNAHVLYQSITISPNPQINVLQNVQALYSDGPQLALPRLPVVDVATLQNNGLACSALPAGSLTGEIALIQRGICPFSDKIDNAQTAGASGVILYMQAGTDPILRPTGTSDTGIPAVMIGYTDGVNLKNLLGSNSGTTAGFNTAFAPVTNPPNSVWPSSSRGPSIGTFTESPYQTFVIKPELVAVGAGLYTATQKLDPSGDAYNATGYTGVSGTSYAVPMVAGVVAMVKQLHPKWTPAQMKSAVVNTANPNVTDTDGTVARVDAVGAGLLKADDALNVAATLDPATIEFGALTTTTVSSSITLNIVNVSSATATFTFQVQPSTTSSVTSSSTVTVSPTSVSLTPGQPNSVSVKLTGIRPAAGSYEGFILVTGGGGPTLRVPYQYLVGSGIVADVFPVFNGGFIAPPSDTGWAIQPRAIDQYGVPVIGSPVLFSVVSGGGSIASGDNQTFRYGVATGFVNLGSQLGLQVFNAKVGTITAEFDGYARPFPAIPAGGVMDAASFQTNRGLAAGSYITIKGTNLADATQVFSTNFLPVSLSAVSVSFDGGGLSLPGHLHFVSPGQINVQVPWEFQGQSSVSMKVSVTGNESYLQSNVYTVPLATYCPNFFLETGGIAAAVDVTLGTIVSQNAPVQRGDVVSLYANGLGPVTNQNVVVSGLPSPLSPLAATTTLPTVTIGGVNAAVYSSDLAPYIVGLYQVNITVPSGVPSGMQPVVLTIGGVSTTAALLPIK